MFAGARETRISRVEIEQTNVGHIAGGHGATKKMNVVEIVHKTRRII